MSRKVSNMKRLGLFTEEKLRLELMESKLKDEYEFVLFDNAPTNKECFDNGVYNLIIDTFDEDVINDTKTNMNKLGLHIICDRTLEPSYKISAFVWAIQFSYTSIVPHDDVCLFLNDSYLLNHNRY